jgi:DNA-binding response OmpR family regulator
MKAKENQKRSVYIVEDDPSTLTKYIEAFSNAGWEEAHSRDSSTALRHLTRRKMYSIILLDLRLPQKRGEKPLDNEGWVLLTELEKKRIPLPPIFIATQFVTAKSILNVILFKVQGLIPKPFNFESLPELLDAYCEGDEHALWKIGKDNNLKLNIIETAENRMYFYGQENIDGEIMDHTVNVETDQREELNRQTKEREKALKKYFLHQAKAPLPFAPREPLLVIGRRWNSWYPSYFNVEGGAYAVIGVKRKDGSIPGAIIDPGFKAISALNSLGISLSCLETCLITHNHPDHIGGIFEYLAGQHVLDYEPRLIASESVIELLETYGVPSKDLIKFELEYEELIQTYSDSLGKSRSIIAKPIVTSHKEIGGKETTRGICLQIENRDKKKGEKHIAKAIILGDTEYHCEAYHPGFNIFRGIRETVCDEKLKVLILHIGSSQLKEKTKGHLYINGVLDILKQLDVDRKNTILNATINKLLVLISEWGLEHATRDQIIESIPQGGNKKLLEGFDSCGLMLKTIEAITSSYKMETLCILPADLGLMVGLESGKIYQKYMASPADQIYATSEPKGLVYHSRKPRRRR